MGRARPEGLFIELYLLGVGLAIDHGTKVGVAYGECFQPNLGGLAVLQSAVGVWGGFLRCLGEGGSHDKGCKEQKDSFFTHGEWF